MSAYRSRSFRIIGVAPLLQHNGRLVDPADPHTRGIAEISGRRKKTDADHLEMGRREFLGSLYLDGGKPCIPAEAIEAAIVKGASKEKRGPAAKAGVLVERNAALVYDGPTDPAALWADERFRLRVPVKVGQARVMRTRPRFDGWSATLDVRYLPTLVNERDLGTFLVAAGEQVGIGDWRPRFGRFTVED